MRTTPPAAPDDAQPQPRGDFYPPNRLAEILSAPGGMTVSDALQHAAEKLQASEAQQLQRIDEALRDLRAIADMAAPSIDQQLRMYDRSSEIVSLAVTVSYRDLSEGAFCLCDLLDNLRQKQVWLKERVQLNLAALAILRRPAEAHESESRAALLASLRKLARLD